MRSMSLQFAASLLQRCSFRAAHDSLSSRAYRTHGASLDQFPYAVARAILPAKFRAALLPCAPAFRLCSSSSSDEEDRFDTDIRPYEKVDVPQTNIVRKKGRDVISGAFLLINYLRSALATCSTGHGSREHLWPQP